MSIVRKTAVISDCGRYRYSLGRVWGDGPLMILVMLNPSTADAEVDDRTISRCMVFARREGCGGIIVVNLFALRATDPSELSVAEDPVGPGNLAILVATLADAARGDLRLVCAWGANPVAEAAAGRFMTLAAGVTLWCLGRTKSGSSRHPLYVRADQPLEVFVRPHPTGSS